MAFKNILGSCLRCIGCLDYLQTFQHFFCHPAPSDRCAYSSTCLLYTAVFMLVPHNDNERDPREMSIA